MKKILAVDNNPVILKFMTTFLGNRGYHVLTAEDGLSALEILKTYTPDVIFIDLIMPNIGGKKLCRIIRSNQKLKDVSIIILSAVATEEETHYSEFGADACIAKGPLNIMSEHILTALSQTGKRRSSQRVMGGDQVHSRLITRELLSSQKHFEIILGSMSEGILELTSDSRIVYANAASTSLLGIEEEKLLASNFTELFHESCRQRVNQALERPDYPPHAISEDSPVALNGKQCSLKVLPIKNGGPGASIVILHDVSLKKKMEAHLRQAQKMEAIGTLAGGIAHDFNNLLMGIQGNASLMLHGIDASNPHHRGLKNIEQSVQNGAELTKQLLGFARGGKYEVRTTNVNELIEESVEMFGRMKKEITVHTKYREDIWPVELDQGQMQQVMVNLLVNAWQAMPGGGDVYIGTEHVALTGIDSKPYQLNAGNYVKISVTDTGVGMDEATRQRIFDPFFTTKEMGRGTGLGLASVYGIVKNHGGAITVRSDLGKGTTFAIYLPASEREVETVPETPDEILEGSERILLVEDERMVLEIGQEMLQALGYEVLTAKGGREALRVYQANHDKIDLVILDMIMPDMSGGETYDRLRKVDPRVRVLLSSGYALDGQASEILKRGCSGFIQKPFDLKVLGRKIREILDPNR